MSEDRAAPDVGARYGRPGVGERILESLRAAGRDVDRLDPRDLAPVDEFHTGGRDATLRPARLAGLAPGMRVLDAGGGLGGPARTLAAEIGCEVTVLDLTEEYCRAGAMLTARSGLGGKVAFRRGDAARTPFEGASFDAVWTRHSSMNVPDKPRLDAELRRVLPPSGLLAMHEILAGPSGPVRFPVPWARDPSISFLAPPEAVRGWIAAAGFREEAWVDETSSARAWFEQRRSARPAAAGSPPPPGLHLLLGDDFETIFRNQVLNLQEGRVAVVVAVFRRAGPAEGPRA
jgi:SAM-dependent methyltransferase